MPWALMAAACHLLLGAYVLFSRGGVLLRANLLLVAAAGVLWGGVLAGSGGAGFQAELTALALASEILLLVAWYMLVHRLLRGPYDQSMPHIVRRLLRLGWGLALCVVIVSVLVREEGADTWAGTLQYGVLFALALVCLALAAQLVRDAPVENRSALRPLVVGAALATSSQAVLLAVAMLESGVPVAVVSFSSLILALSALLTLFSLRLHPQWSLAIFVSPEARSYAPRFLAMGAMFLLLMLALPVYRTIGPGEPRQLVLLVLAVSGAAVLALLFSERLNARLRVWVSKHFLPFRYDYREEWLRLIETLVSRDSKLPLPERVIKAVAQIVGSPAGVLWIRQFEDGPFVSTAGWNMRLWSEARVAADDPAILFMLQRQWIIDTAELTRRPELYGGLARPAWLEPFPETALLIVPLISNEDLIGFMALLQSSSAFRLTFEEIDLLRTSGRQVAAFLAQYEADQRLAESRQFEAFNRLTAFVMHDLKNLIAQQSLMVKNAAKHKGNPAFFEDAIATIDNSVARMNKLLQQLQSRDTTGPTQRIRLGTAVADAVDRCLVREPAPVLEDDSGDFQVWIDRERLSAIIAHLIRNAQEATTRDGSVVVRVEAVREKAVISIRDDGCGMDQEFVRTRLFRPFDTTKGSKGMGIGAYQARTFVTEAGGTLRVDTEPGRGTCFVIELPSEAMETERPIV